LKLLLALPVPLAAGVGTTLMGALLSVPGTMMEMLPAGLPCRTASVGRRVEVVVSGDGLVTMRVAMIGGSSRGITPGMVGRDGRINVVAVMASAGAPSNTVGLVASTGADRRGTTVVTTVADRRATTPATMVADRRATTLATTVADRRATTPATMVADRRATTLVITVADRSGTTAVATGAGNRGVTPVTGKAGRANTLVRTDVLRGPNFTGVPVDNLRVGFRLVADSDSVKVAGGLADGGDTEVSPGRHSGISFRT
jgi:hypothetical protein